MQLLSAFSRPQTVPDARATAPRKSLWILDSWRDLILYVGTPLVLLPAFALAQSRWSAQDIYRFVAAFGAMGHHLPGMIRAYGDRALFERFRWRFIFAPLFLLVTCVAFYWWDLKGIILVCDSGRVVANANDGHIGPVLFQRRTLHSAVGLASGATWLCFFRARRLDFVRCEFCLDVDAGEATEPGQASAIEHQHQFLVVLQQRRLKSSRRDRVVRS